MCPETADVLLESLEGKLAELEETIGNCYLLIKGAESKKPKAVKAWNSIKIDMAIDYYRDFLGIYASKAELSHLTGLDPKTLERIITDEEFNLGIRAMKKTTAPRIYKKASEEKVGEVKIPILIPRKSRNSPKGGRPSVRYADSSYKGMAKSVAFWIDAFSSVGQRIREKHPKLIQDLEKYLQILDDEEKGEVARIKSEAMDKNYLLMMTGAIAHQIIRIYASPSTGSVYSKAHETFGSLVSRMVEILKAYAKHRMPIQEEIENYRQSMNKNLKRIEALAKFAENAKKNRANFIALAFKDWMDRYGGEAHIQDIGNIVLKAGSVAEVTDAILDTVKEQVENVITLWI